MTHDAYGRYVGRHRDWRDDPPGYAIDLDDGRHNLVARALFDDGTSEDRYDRPIEPVPVPRWPSFVEPCVPVRSVA